MKTRKFCSPLNERISLNSSSFGIFYRQYYDKGKNSSWKYVPFQSFEAFEARMSEKRSASSLKPQSFYPPENRGKTEFEIHKQEVIKYFAQEAVAEKKKGRSVTAFTVSFYDFGFSEEYEIEDFSTQSLLAVMRNVVENNNNTKKARQYLASKELDSGVER